MEPPVPVAQPAGEAASALRPVRLRPWRARTLSTAPRSAPRPDRPPALGLRHLPRRPANWTRARFVTSDPRPALYVHEYTASGVTVRGVVGLLDLGPASSPGPAVLPHEAVHPHQVSDLADRMEELLLDPAPILLLHRGGGALSELLAEPLAPPAESRPEPLPGPASVPSAAVPRADETAFSDRAGQVHRLRAVRDDRVVSRLDEALATSRVLIADGHHRYAAYLRLRDRGAHAGWRHGLAMVVDQDETPLWVGAIHRHIAGRRVEEVVAALEDLPGVRCEHATRQRALELLNRRTPVLTDQRTWVAVRLPETDPELAVFTVDQVVASRLGVPKGRVSYHHAVEAALRPELAADGVAILMPAPPFDDVVEAAETGRLLPEKATSFQPKPSAGVLVRNLRDE